MFVIMGTIERSWTNEEKITYTNYSRPHFIGVGSPCVSNYLQEIFLF